MTANNWKRCMSNASTALCWPSLTSLPLQYSKHVLNCFWKSSKTDWGRPTDWHRNFRFGAAMIEVLTAKCHELVPGNNVAATSPSMLRPVSHQTHCRFNYLHL
mmetsp:Transcript_45811/g.90248  ORF Transcript_45811/g.90248 Transcript_45811/m.90248 type:complete len:103 (-) Transcript_45811:279-587(-)